MIIRTVSMPLVTVCARVRSLFPPPQGSTLFPNFPGRVCAEATSRVAASMRVKVVAGRGRGNAVWAGASFLASLDTFAPMWVTREDYDEHGPQIVHTKCC